MSEILLFILTIGTIANIIYKHKEKLKKLSIAQITGILISFILTVGLSTTLIYYGGNWIVRQIPVEWVSTIISYIIVIIVIVGAVILWNKAVSKIINESENVVE